MPINLGPWGRPTSLSPWSSAAEHIVEAGRAKGAVVGNLLGGVGAGLGNIADNKRKAKDEILEREKFDFLKENSRADNDRASATLLWNMYEAQDKEYQEAQIQAEQGDPDAMAKIQRLGPQRERTRQYAETATNRATQPQRAPGKGG
jgi:hypothetical protein